jgi:WD40 repeat protein
MPKPALGALIGRGFAAVLLLLATACLGAPDSTPSPVAQAPATNAPARPSATAPLPTATEVAVAAPTASAVAERVTTPTSTPAPSASPTPTTRNPLILQALSAMAAVHTYHYTATVQTFDDGHKLQSSREGDYEAPAGLRWVNVVDNITTTAVLTDDVYYVAVDTGAWTSVPGGAQERAHQLSWQLMARAQDVVEAGRDPATDPDPTVHLTFTLPLDNLPLEARPWQVAQGEVWLGVTDYRVRAYKLYAQEPRYETTERVFLSAYNVPVQIAIPVVDTADAGRQGRLLYAHRGPGGSDMAELRIRDLESGTEQTLPDARGNIYTAAWSSDGRQIVYGADGSLYVFDLTTSKLLNIGRGDAPTFNPDGSLLAFARGTGQRTHPWTMDALGNNALRLNDYYAQYLDWSPDGTRILFSGTPATSDPAEDKAQLFSMAADGSDVQALPPLPGAVTAPRWSNAGDRIALIVAGQLGIADADGTHLTVLDNSHLNTAPVWSPDDSFVVYAHRAAQDAPSRILIRPVDGSDAQPLTAGDDIPLAWH